METEQVKARQSATLYSWNTSTDQIKVRLNGSHLEVKIGDLSIILSASAGVQPLDLVKKFGEVEVSQTTTGTIRV